MSNRDKYNVHSAGSKGMPLQGTVTDSNEIEGGGVSLGGSCKTTVTLAGIEHDTDPKAEDAWESVSTSG
jgi:hypothetical protein